MTPSRYETLPVPESYESVIPILERLIHPAWMQDAARQRAIHRYIRVWALYVAGGITLDDIGSHLDVSRERVRQMVAKIQEAIDGLTIPEAVAAAIEYHLGRSRAEEIIIDDRLHATHMIVSHEDHDAIERAKDGDRLSFQLKERGMRQGQRCSWNGVENNKPMFGRANEARLQKQWYDRVQKTYWYDPGAKRVYERF